jgi:hypothetical protein
MKKPALLLAAVALTAGVSVALAAKPKPMPCGAWACKGSSCAPAKYAKVRSLPILFPFYSSPIYGAAAIEGGLGFAAFLLGSTVARRRRIAGELRPVSPAPRETTSGP